MEESSVVKPWGKFKIDLCNMLVKEDLRQAVLLVRGQISESRREKVSEPTDLLEALEDNGIINEDRTDPLIEILRTIGHVEAIEDLLHYRKSRDEYRENVRLLSGKHDPLFVGRDDYIRRIIDVFGRSANLVCCVCLYGLAGTGKTTLAVETSAIYKELQRPQPRLIKVDLRKRSNVTDAGVALMTSLGRQVSSKDFDPSMVNTWIREATQQENVILMDNADELLQPLSLSRGYFINMMMDLLSTQNRKVKIIITTRYAMRHSSLNDTPNYEEIEVRALEVRESMLLLSKECQMAHGEAEKTIAEHTAEEIANHCGNNPQALRAVAKRLKSGTFSAERLAEMLRKPHLANRVLDLGLLGSTSLEAGEEENVKQKLVLQTLKATFDMLPQRLQEALVRLSVFPGSFDRQKAKAVLGMDDVEAVDLEIDDLRHWSLVECEEYRGFDYSVEPARRQYAIHPLIRTVCMIEGMKGEKYNNAFSDALSRMCKFVANLMEQLAIEGHTDYSRALSRFEEEKPIFTHYMEMDMGETFAGFKLASPFLEEENSARERARLSTSSFAESTYMLFKCLMDVEKLEQYFRCKTKQMKDKDELEAWAFVSGCLADQYMVSAKYAEAWESLKDPLNWLQSLSPPLSKDADLAKAQCKAIQGRYLAAKPNPDLKQALKVIEEAFSLRKKHLGDNSLTARCLNFLGHVYHKNKDVNKSKSFHEQAWEMLARITNGNPEQHFDAPTYSLNIGTAYHQLGNTKMDKHQKTKAKEYYRHAISFFDRALEIEKRLQNSKTAVILKNKAMSYCEMEEYENALPLAVRASELRKKGLRTHPDTSRSLFFVGSLYDDIGKKEKKASNMPGEEVQSLQDALKYYKEALKYEWKLGPDRRSWEYNQLKDDFKKLLKLMHEDPQPYERLFHQAEQGDKGDFDAVIPGKKTTQDEASTSSPKRKLTGLEDMPESPKSSRCTLAYKDETNIFRPKLVC